MHILKKLTNKNFSTKSQQAKPSARNKKSSLKLGRVLSFVLMVAVAKLSLLFGILLFPNSLPPIEIRTITQALFEPKVKKPSDVELRLIAKLEAQAKENPALQAQLSGQKKQNITSETPVVESAPKAERNISLVNTAYAAENTPPPPDPKVATPNPSPMVPQVRPMDSPLAPERFQRPDSASADTIPAPSVQNPYAPSDTAQRQQEEFNRREQELRALQQQMESRMNELKGLEGKLETMVNTADKAEEEKLKHLIDVYSNMKAKQAAEVLATLDEKVAVKILSGMKGRQAGEILTYMDPKRAVVLSELLAKVGK